MQVENKASLSLRETIRKTYYEHGIRGFYYGMTPPLLATGFINTLLWGMQFNLVELITPKGQLSNTKHVMQAAVISGLAISIVVTPMELVKSKLQIGRGDRGSLEVIRETVHRSGISGMYRGLSAVALVRASNWAYFGSYAMVQNLLSSIPGAPKSRQANAVIAGGCSGVCFWFVAFGFDVIKARMMVDDKPLGFFKTAESIYQQHGIKGFTKGFTPCVIRAFPANAAAFFGFETAMRFMNK